MDHLINITRSYIRKSTDRTTNVLFFGKIASEDHQIFRSYARRLKNILKDEQGKIKIIVNSHSEITDIGGPSALFEQPEVTEK